MKFKFFKKEIVFSEYRPLIGSFLLALLLWSAVTTDKVYTIRLTLPLRIVSIAPNYVLKNPPPKVVHLKVRGKGRALISLYFYKPVIQLELPHIDHTVDLRLADYQNQFYVGQDLGIQIEDILEPRVIHLEVDKYKEALKPIHVNEQIKPLPGFLLTKIIPERDSVLVMGPASLVDAVKQVETDSLHKARVRYPFEEQLQLHSPAPGIIKIKPLRVNVKFFIEQIVERRLYNIPIQIIGVPPDLIPIAIPPVVSVRVKGSEQLVSSILPEQVTAVFDYKNDYHVGRSYYMPHIEVPDGVQIVQISPRSFRLLLKKRNENQ